MGAIYCFVGGIAMVLGDKVCDVRVLLLQKG